MSDSKDSKLEKIKKEGAEDASSYYAQGDKGDAHDLKGEYTKPLPSVDSTTEEFNLVRTLSYLAFGGAGLALVFILFFIRDLDKRVDHVGKEVVDLAPFKKEVGDNLSKLNADVDKLRGRVEQYEKAAMIMELKRAMATVLAVTESSAELKAKSAQVVASIQTLLDELEGGAKASAPTAGAPTTDAKPADATAPATGAPAAPATETKPAETPALAAGTPAAPESKPAEATTPAASATPPAATPATPPATPAVAAPATPPAAPVAKADTKPAGAKKKAAKGDDDDEDDD